MSVPSLERPDNDGHRPQLVISGHDNYITDIAYLPDGRVVTSSRDGLVKIWNVESGREERKIEHCGWVETLAVTSDGTKIISTEWQGNKVKVWDVTSHKLVKAWTQRKTFIRVAISPDDQLVAVGKRGVVFYTLEGKKVNYTTNIEDVGKELDSIYSMSFSPDGSKLACASISDAFVYDVKSGAPVLGLLNGHRIRTTCVVLWSRDGSRLFSANNNAIVTAREGANPRLDNLVVTKRACMLRSNHTKKKSYLFVHPLHHQSPYHPRQTEQ
ncbi:WD40-repeat-containing domain protein [Tylopilus felleus]